MISLSKFLDLIGRENLTARFGFRNQDISRAVRDNKFPAGWFPFIRDICGDMGLEVPEHLFRWSNVPKKKKKFMAENPPKSDSEAA